MKGLLYLVAFALTDLGLSSLTVETSNGPVIGHPAPGAPGVREFLGIPYANPPVDDLRFSAPERYSIKNSPFEASNDCVFTPSSAVDFPDKTPQFDRVVAAFTGRNDNKQSEDCLSLNIWSSYEKGYVKGKTPKKPILVFFHGGRYTAGDTNTPFLNGKYFADAQDVVVVTVNYRINIFGFPGAPGQTQNLGLLDQRLAVEWVRDNAKAFDGDPERITIFGQSAGSVAVDFWSYAWKEDPIVAGLISHSGTVFSFPVNSEELATRHWYNASSLLGCGSSGDVMPCMRSKSAEEIKKAITEIPPPEGTSVARSQPVFQPTPDGIVVFDDYENLSAAGKFAPIPYIVGHTDNEAGFYNISAFGKGNILPEEEWTLFNKDVFNCPTSRTVTDRASHGVPVWRYRYHADWDNTRLYPTSRAYHGTDLHMIFGASADVSLLPESPEQIELKRMMQAAWAEFAVDPKDGLKRMGFPTFDPNGKTLIQIGVDNKPTASFIDPKEYDDAC
ncbi:hypothetical protein AJ79_05202 [Helicocarpus griseus UAMH5409]|uniref:Carboxylesterase type B domain-containing protein n=1 Tax=Helicocarpus griseus UAMH5409 TaxID=1447875 RepID=A0A2B7XP66_9EURO|nr:hypothetical protein AJ79_05202 [Helicocarpus griseus UAMH5409]